MQTCNIKGAGQQLSVTRQAIIWGISRCATLAVLKRKRSQIIYGWLIQKINAGELHHSTKQSPGVHGGCRRAEHSKPGCLAPNSPKQGLALGSGHWAELVWWPGHSSVPALTGLRQGWSSQGRAGAAPTAQPLCQEHPQDLLLPWPPMLCMLQRFPALCGSSSTVLYSSPRAVFAI